MVEGTPSPRDLMWRRAGGCESTQCVEVALTDAKVLIRNSGQPYGSVVTFDHGEWRRFVAAVTAGEFAV